MIAELLEGIGVGGGVAVIAGFVGNVMGYSRGRAERNIAALFVTGQAESLWCVCGHSMSFHGKGRDACHARNEELTAAQVAQLAGEHFERWKKATLCRCQRFVGDPGRNPKPAVERPGDLSL